jgi:archaellum component FlaG (FlaF/FlaG flagellin family)
VNLYSKMLLTSATILVASGSIAQERFHPPDPNLMARFSYDNSGVVRPGNVRHVCVAVSRDGDYRIVRALDNGQTQRLHGKMSKEESRQLNNLLEAAE